MVLYLEWSGSEMAFELLEEVSSITPSLFQIKKKKSAKISLMSQRSFYNYLC